MTYCKHGIYATDRCEECDLELEKGEIMTENQQAAFIISQSVAAYAEIEGMKAYNQHQLAIGETSLYDEKVFSQIPQRFGISHNQILALFQK